MRLTGKMSKAFHAIGAVWIAVVGLYILAVLFSPAMLQWSQAANIMQVAAFVGVIACGQTIVLIVGGIDLSQAGTVTLTNIVATSLMLGSNSNIPWTIAACIVLAAAIGAFNAFLVVKLRITPLIATLSTNSILFGAALVYTGGAPHGSAAPGFLWMGQGHFFGIPASTICWLVVAASLQWIIRETVAGRWLFATGSNQVAARMMGVPVRSVTAAAYIASALSAMFGSLLLTAYVGSPSLGIGNQFLFSAIAAAVVGGTALTGGVGSVFATVGGAIFVTELDSFTNIIQVSTGTRMVLQGLIIATSVLLYRAIAANRSV